MPPTLSNSPLSSTWAWIPSIYIINAFHLGSPCPRSYHHIPYPLHDNVQHAFHIPLICMATNPSNIATWHAFLLFLFLMFVLSSTRWWKRPPKYLHSPLSIHSWRLIGKLCNLRTHNQSPSSNFFEIFKNNYNFFSTSINTIMLCMANTCNGICLNSVCIGFEHFDYPI